MACPTWLRDDPAALAHWDDTAPSLHALGLLTQLDVHVWARACALWSRLAALHQLLATDGLVLMADSGHGRLHPARKCEQLVLAEYVR